MALPDEVSKARRPKNTVVCDTGYDTINRYIVRKRYRDSDTGKVINGEVVGHIINGRYVAASNRRLTLNDVPETASYGAATLAYNQSRDLLDDLLSIYEAKQAETILVIALLRVLHPGITDTTMKEEYNQTFIRIYYPGVPLSRNEVGGLVNELGEHPSLSRSFYQKRIERLPANEHIAVDGTLKTNNGKINDFSGFSFKGRIKGWKDISIIYAFDVEQLEPIALEVFPGNRTDASAYDHFISSNHLTRGLILDDKGFPPGCIKDELKAHPDLHYFTPIRRNAAVIRENDMLDFEKVLADVPNDTVYYKKKQLKDGTYLYAFMSLSKHTLEMHGYARHVEKVKVGENSFAKKVQTAGAIVYQSDADLTPMAAYLCHSERWIIELSFKLYKDDLCLETPRVHDDFSITGNEFINFISVVISCRILRKAYLTKVLDRMTYGEMMWRLSQVRRRTDDTSTPVALDDGWENASLIDYRLMEDLGLCKAMPKPAPKRRGRPPKNKTVDLAGSDVSAASNLPVKAKGDVDTASPDTESYKASDDKATEAIPYKPKKAGRPRIHPLPDPNVPKRPVGRPRVHPLPDPNKPKRHVGRPRIHPAPDPNEPKRRVGTPGKNY